MPCHLSGKGQSTMSNFDFLETGAEFYCLSDEVIKISLFWLLFPTKAIFCPFLKIDDQESNILSFPVDFLNVKCYEMVKKH